MLRNRASKIWRSLLGIGVAVAIVTVAPAEASADPAPVAGTSSTGSVTVHGSSAAKVLGTAIYRPTNGVVSPFQDPPLGGCNYEQVHVSWTATYTNGVITSAVITFGSSITCTTTAAGQSMAALSTQATLWHNGTNISATAAKGCGTCNVVAATDKAVSCLSTACPGSYWGSGDQIMQLPAGWLWSSWGSDCVAPLPQTPDVLECFPITNTTTIPATH